MDDGHDSSAIQLLPALPLSSPRPPGLVGALPGYRTWLRDELVRRSQPHIEPIDRPEVSTERAREPTREGVPANPMLREALMVGLLPQLHANVTRQPLHMAFVAPAKLASRPPPPPQRRFLPQSPRSSIGSPRRTSLTRRRECPRRKGRRSWNSSATSMRGRPRSRTRRAPREPASAGGAFYFL